MMIIKTKLKELMKMRVNSQCKWSLFENAAPHNNSNDKLRKKVFTSSYHKRLVVAEP